jgi:hypothetical protein
MLFLTPLPPDRCPLTADRSRDTLPRVLAGNVAVLHVPRESNVLEIDDPRA